MTVFTPGDKVRITAKGRKVAIDRRYAIPPGEWEVKQTHGSGNRHQVLVRHEWWPARAWEKT